MRLVTMATYISPLQEVNITVSVLALTLWHRAGDPSHESRIGSKQQKSKTKQGHYQDNRMARERSGG
jgi:hypothetical protein